MRVVEGNRSRIQVFQGVVIRRQGGGVRETFTVRKVSFGVGVERTFPVHTPIIEKIEVVTRGDVRRAKLYYLRDLRGKKAKIKEKRDTRSHADAAAHICIRRRRLPGVRDETRWEAPPSRADPEPEPGRTGGTAADANRREAAARSGASCRCCSSSRSSSRC